MASPFGGLSSHSQNEAVGWDTPPGPSGLKSVSGVNHFSEAPLLAPHKQPLLHLIKFLRQND